MEQDRQSISNHKVEINRLSVLIKNMSENHTQLVRLSATNSGAIVNNEEFLVTQYTEYCEGLKIIILNPIPDMDLIGKSIDGFTYYLSLLKTILNKKNTTLDHGDYIHSIKFTNEQDQLSQGYNLLISEHKNYVDYIKKTCSQTINRKQNRFNKRETEILKSDDRPGKQHRIDIKTLGYNMKIQDIQSFFENLLVIQDEIITNFKDLITKYQSEYIDPSNKCLK